MIKFRDRIIRRPFSPILIFLLLLTVLWDDLEEDSSFPPDSAGLLKIKIKKPENPTPKPDKPVKSQISNSKTHPEASGFPITQRPDYISIGDASHSFNLNLTIPLELPQRTAFPKTSARQVFELHELSQPALVAGWIIEEPPRLRKTRFWVVQTGVALIGLASFRKMQTLFGEVAQPFRIGNDWTADNAVHFDELLHFQGSYRLTQGIADLYKWSGVNSRTSELLSAGIIASAMTFLEYLDGRRADDYASYSDLTANLMGVTFAYMKPRVPFFQKIDFRVSYSNITDPFKSESLINYDRMIQWVTYDLSSHLKLPLDIGVGYGVKSAYSASAQPELHIGLGFSLGKLLMPKRRKAVHPLRILDSYQVGFSKKL